ncbi:acyl--CoA ligase [Aquihabitans sp. G128]|uniref:class I adenylate-forming enzyme family protein n=1 Tax=Aquihabitans sp. G128 TaxID=2849779 RepID=UPI001C237B82|nr:class I adenylate-forming enzyme family protein [Aquihabitans sp. G128]QXC61086.1 acyl--CoA ligase [Aquihabitans sp. G128]
MRDMDRSAIEQLQMHGQDIGQLLAHWAEQKPEHGALVWEPFEGDGQRWTYAELLAEVHGLAAGLRDRGIGLDDKVLIHAENCPEMLLAWLAVAVVGGVAVTTNTKSAPAEVGWFIDKAQCVAAITQPEFTDHVATAERDLRWVAVMGGTPGEGHLSFDDLRGDAASWTGREIEPLRPFGIMFTSGTTNKPKAVVHTHANAVWASRVGPRNIDLRTDDRYLIYLPLFHVNAQSWSMFSILGVGATAVLMPKWSSSRFWDVVARNEITHISLMPFVIPTLMEAEKPDNVLRIGVFGLILKMLDDLCGIDVYAAYGMTETVIHATNGRPADLLPEKSMGHITPGYEWAVVDKDTGELCPEGVTGELWLKGTRGIQLFLEYFDNPEANEKAFEGDWFKTGDMVQLGAGGNLFYKERDKDLLKVGGENVSAREVEDVIGTVPGITSSAVVGKHHEFLDEVVVAFVITNPMAPDDETLEKQIIETCREQLAAFKVPRAVYVVPEFPTGTLDKILKNKLREMADARPEV